MRQRPKYRPVPAFVRTLSTSLPIDITPVLAALENDADPVVAAALLGRLLRDAYTSQQQTIANLHNRLAFWQQHAMNYRHSWEACMAEPLREHFRQAQDEITALQQRLSEADKQVKQLSLRCTFLENEKTRLENLLEEHQRIVARQQVRLLELDDDAV
ncbi:MAG: hypothetical protein D6694_00940 [Gammaproteobacteria bacterium]|nr:MAG: hypothetical protein D6694_00940 [Gammaproteobacteria bacterium]